MMNAANESLAGKIGIDEAVDRICGAFLSQAGRFENAQRDIAFVREYSLAVGEIKRISNYLSLTGITSEGEIEQVKAKLRYLTAKWACEPTEHVRREVGYAWEKFLRLYTVHYAELHNQRAAGPIDVRPIRRSRTRKSQRCSLDPIPYLRSVPFCRCGFQISGASSPEQALSHPDLSPVGIGESLLEEIIPLDV
jgi:hypothetical protein